MLPPTCVGSHCLRRKDEQTVWDNAFSWTGATGATSYQLEVYDTDTSLRIFRQWLTAGTAGCDGDLSCAVFTSQSGIPGERELPLAGAALWQQLRLRVVDTVHELHREPVAQGRTPHSVIKSCKRCPLRDVACRTGPDGIKIKPLDLPIKRLDSWVERLYSIEGYWMVSIGSSGCTSFHMAMISAWLLPIFVALRHLPRKFTLTFLSMEGLTRTWILTVPSFLPIGR